MVNFDELANVRGYPIGERCMNDTHLGMGGRKSKCRDCEYDDDQALIERLERERDEARRIAIMFYDWLIEYDDQDATTTNLIESWRGDDA